MKLNKLLTIPLLFFFLAAFCLRSIMKSGILGHTWDWVIPLFPQQLVNMAVSNMFTWSYTNLGGFSKLIAAELPYWLLILPFSFLGGSFISKLIPFFILVLSLITMFIFSRKIFKLRLYWAIFSAVIYALSPIVLSRLIAGNLTSLLSYALLPFFSLFLFKLFELPKKSTTKEYLKQILPLIILFPFLTVHYNMAVITSLTFSLFGLYYFFKKGCQKKVFLTFLLSGLTFLLVESFLLSSITHSVFTKKEISLRNWDDLADKEFLPKRLDYLNQHSQPLINVLTLNFPNNLYTEFVYPLPDYFKPIYIIVIIFLFGLSFSSIILIKNNKRVGFLLVTLFLGIILASGTRTILGKVFYQLLFKFLLPVGAGFVNALRFLPLVFLPLAILSPLMLQTIEEKLNNTNKKVLKIFTLIALTFLFYPWFFRPLTKPLYENDSQPLSLQINSIHPEEKKVFDYFINFSGDFRVVFLPSFYISWPGPTNLSYNWNIFSYAKPVFLENIYPSLAKEIINGLYSSRFDFNISRLLGLASVKMIAYPHYQEFGAYQNFVPGEINYKKNIDQNLNQQNDLELKKTDFSTIDIYENKDFLPHFYVPKNLIYTEEDTSIFPQIVTSHNYELRSAIFTKTENSYQEKILPIINQLVVIKSIDEKNLISNPNLIEHQCRKSSYVPQLISCKIINYQSAANYKISFEYSLSQGKASFFLAENDNDNQNITNLTPMVIQDIPKTEINKTEKIEYKFQSKTDPKTTYLYFFTENSNGQLANLDLKSISLKEGFPQSISLKTKNNETKNIPKIIFKRINPTKYLVDIKDAKDPYLLVFSETFHQDWKLYKTNYSPLNNQEIIASYFNDEIKEVKHQMTFLDKNTFETWGKKSIADDYHFLVNGFSNAWYIKPEIVANQENYQLIVEFWPQRLYLIGLIISGLTFLSAVILLVFTSLKLRKRKL